MRRLPALLAVAALAASLLAAQPARAHAEFSIVGFQFAFNDGIEIGLAGYISTPAGPVSLGAPPSSDGVASVTNRDVQTHTFTACVAACDTATPTYDPAIFNFLLNPGDEAFIDGLWSGTMIFGCQLYPWMRGAFTVEA